MKLSISGLLILIGSKYANAHKPIDPLQFQLERMFKEMYDVCAENEGTFFFNSIEEAICLKSSTDFIDFSNKTEIVGKNFSRKVTSRDKPFIMEDNVLKSYRWPLCDSESQDYNFNRCMFEASFFKTFENPAGVDIIKDLFTCKSYKGNAFYYSNDPVDETKYEFVCIEERPLNYFDTTYVSSGDVVLTSIKDKLPISCIEKDNQYVCGKIYKINGGNVVYNTESSFSSYEGDYYKDLSEVLSKTDSMKKIDLNPLVYLIDENKPSITTLVATQNTGYLTHKVMKIPENVNKMMMTCKQSAYFGEKKPQTVKVSESDNVFDVYDFYTSVDDEKTCYIFTQQYTPMTTSYKKDFCKTIATYISEPTPTYTLQEHCQTLTFRKNATPIVITKPVPIIKPECQHGYPCCSECGEVVYVDSDASWGLENNEWCELLESCL